MKDRPSEHVHIEDQDDRRLVVIHDDAWERWIIAGLVVALVVFGISLGYVIVDANVEHDRQISQLQDECSLLDTGSLVP